MSEQTLIMEAEADTFKIIPKYLNALPRSTHDELHALNQKLIQRGQQEPIKVRRDMGILNGYTRHDLLGQRGVKIKYEFKDFETEEEEFAYVVESNIMQRHLNVFQRVETMYQFYIETKLEKRLTNRTAHFDIFRALKYGAVTVKDMMKLTKYSKKTVSRLANELTESYFVSKTIEYKNELGNYRTAKYKLMPKGEEALLKSKPRRLGASMDILSEVVGVGVYSIRNAVNIINHNDMDIIERCRSGQLSLSQGHTLISDNRGRNQKGISKNMWGRFTKIKCPKCDHVGTKEDYIRV